MHELTFDQDLRAIAARATFPAAPSLRARVLAGIDEPRGARRRTSRAPYAFAAAAMAIVVAVIAAALAVPGSRTAIADFFGVEGSEIEVVPSATAFAPPEDIGATARPASLDEARDALGFALALPPGAGEPVAVYVVRYGTQDVAVARYGEFDLWQARLDTDASFGKGAPPGVTVEDTFVAGMPARWISGGPHIVQFNSPDGALVPGSERTVDANTLIWNDGDTFFRMETKLAFADARRIAESVP